MRMATGNDTFRQHPAFPVAGKATSPSPSTLLPYPCCSLCLFIIPFFPLWSSFLQVFPACPFSPPSPSPSTCYLLASLPRSGDSLVPPYLIHSYCVCPSSLSQLLFHLLPASSPPSFKPARQSLLQQGRLISIANTQRPPQPDIILHLSVMNISHLPQEGFIQHGRVGRGEGNMVPQHKLGQHQQIQERALSHGNSMPRVSPSVSWVQDPSPGFSPRLSLGLEGRSVPSLLPHPPQFPVR